MEVADWLGRSRCEALRRGDRKRIPSDGIGSFDRFARNDSFNFVERLGLGGCGGQNWARHAVPLHGMRVALVDEIDDVLGGGAGEKDFGDSRLLQRGNVGSGNDSADQHRNIVHAFGAQ
jgi:hypothetical protein